MGEMYVNYFKGMNYSCATCKSAKSDLGTNIHNPANDYEYVYLK